MQHKLLLATHPAAFRVPSVLKVRHSKSWTPSNAVPDSALFGDLSPLSHLGVCLFFQEAHFADQTSRKPLIFVWLFSVPSVTCRSKGGSGGWDQRLQKDPCSNNQAVIITKLPWQGTNPLSKNVRMSITYPSPFRCFENLFCSLQNKLQLTLLVPHHHF